MALGDYLRGEVVEDFGDGLMTRREALRRLCLLGLSLPAASALLAACSDSGSDDPEPGGVASTSTSAAPAASGAETIRFPGAGGEVQAAFAAPESPLAVVLVIHENRGLTQHFFDLVGRLSREGYAALAVDLLSPEGGTASLTDAAGPSAALSAAPLERLLGDLRAGIDELLRRYPGKKVGVVGFCFGGGMTWQLLHTGESRIAAAAPFYGTVPSSPDFTKARAAVLGVYAEQDARVNASREAAEAALKAASLTHEIRTFAGADHAFFNDTGARYNATAAAEAWTALNAWFKRYLA